MTAEAKIRLAFFIGTFALVGLLEMVSPRRTLTTSKSGRWFANIVIIALNPVSIRLVFPIVPVGMAIFAQERSWGFLNYVGLSYWLEVVIAVILLDFTIYLQHVLHHAVPLLWRLHMMHHSDLDIDVTTGMRFHPIEILLSLGIKIAAVAVIGPPVLAVLIFEVALNSTTLFNHSNLRIPEELDRILRILVVTPDMHRVHHSVIIRETNSNYGFNLPWWDRLFGTYNAQPERGHQGMSIGLSQFRDPKKLSLPQLLVLPFVGDPGRVPINRH
ncbi:MAG: sterol desaturase family protein [Desulfobacteraceae bacterium]|nr:MAG: sterol desaturase family protein [Desulfobacteraceae bacterium]